MIPHNPNFVPRPPKPPPVRGQASKIIAALQSGPMTRLELFRAVNPTVRMVARECAAPAWSDRLQDAVATGKVMYRDVSPCPYHGTVYELRGGR